MVLTQFVLSSASLRTLYTLIRYICLRILADGSTLFAYSVASSSSYLTSIVIVLRMISPLIIRLAATIDAATGQALFLNIWTSYILVEPVNALLISLLSNRSVIYIAFVLLIIVGGGEKGSGPIVLLARLGLGGVPPSTQAQLFVFLAYQGASTFTYRPRLSSLIACLSSSNSYIQSYILRSSAQRSRYIYSYSSLNFSPYIAYMPLIVLYFILSMCLLLTGLPQRPSFALPSLFAAFYSVF